jgi:hypothetical protein
MEESGGAVVRLGVTLSDRVTRSVWKIAHAEKPLEVAVAGQQIGVVELCRGVDNGVGERGDGGV